MICHIYKINNPNNLSLNNFITKLSIQLTINILYIKNQSNKIKGINSQITKKYQHAHIHAHNTNNHVIDSNTTFQLITPLNNSIYLTYLLFPLLSESDNHKKDICIHIRKYHKVTQRVNT